MVRWDIWLVLVIELKIEMIFVIFGLRYLFGIVIGNIWDGGCFVRLIFGLIVISIDFFFVNFEDDYEVWMRNFCCLLVFS